MKKIIIPILLLAIIGGAFFFWKGSGEMLDSASLDIMILDSPKVPSEEGTLTENRWIERIEAEMLERGIQVKFKSRAGSLVANTIMMATGSAPDIAMTHNRLLFSKYASDGGLHDLGPYLDEFGPNIKKTLSEDFLEYGVINGVQYAIPVRPFPFERQYISHIRKDWLDALGLDVPSNREELVIALKAFKEKDPGNIGHENVIPWGFFPPDPGTVFEADFRIFDAMYSFMEHDPAKNLSMTWPHREGIKDFLKWMHDIYQDGLISPEFATTSYSEKERKIINGQVGFFHTGLGGLYNNNGILSKVAESGKSIEYIPLQVFQNSAGEYPKVRSRPASFYVFVPKKSKKIEEAVTYLNWLLEEETQQWMNYGIEGEHYRVEDGKSVLIDLDHYVNTFEYLASYIRILGSYPKDQADYDQYLGTTTVVDFNGIDKLASQISAQGAFKAPLYTEEMPLMAKHGSGLIKISEKYWVKMLTEENFEENYAEFMQKLSDQKIDLIDQEKADYYQRHK